MTTPTIDDVAQTCAEKILSKSDGILGVYVRANIRGRLSANGIAVREQQRLNGVMVDVLDLHDKIGGSIRVAAQKCDMTIASHEFDDVQIIVAYTWAHEIAKSLSRMLQRTTRKLAELARQENGVAA